MERVKSKGRRVEILRADGKGGESRILPRRTGKDAGEDAPDTAGRRPALLLSGVVCRSSQAIPDSAGKAERRPEGRR